jgi:hypothetical protein
VARTGYDLPSPQRGQRNPSDHLNRARYARHASSVPNFGSISVRFRGYSSTTPAYYILGPPESSGYPPSVNAKRKLPRIPTKAGCGTQSCNSAAKRRRWSITRKRSVPGTWPRA